jgi:glycosyltransferase involved in cell wall biosynthesis
MSSGPRVVLGLPIYNPGEPLVEAFESLLAQTYRDYAVVVVDDSTTDEPGLAVGRYAAGRSDIAYEHHAERLGMAGNWRRAFTLAGERFEGFELFAWVSDHDVWHPRWLEALVSALDADPGAVLAYPLSWRIGDEGDVPRVAAQFDTAGIESPRVRLTAAISGMGAGTMVYGLYRAHALARAGVFLDYLAPDRLLLTELSLYGHFVQVPETLWYRRYRHEVSPERQRRALFAGDPPRSARLPWPLVHAVVLTRRLVVEGVGLPEIGRVRGAGLSALHAWGLAARARRRRREAREKRRLKERKRRLKERKRRKKRRKEVRRALARRVRALRSAQRLTNRP